MLFRGKEFRKCLAATETAAEINEDYFQQDHRDTDDDDVPPLSPLVTPQNVICPPPSSKKTKFDKEKRFRSTTDMEEELIRCLAEQKSLDEFKGLDFEADLVQLYTNIRVMMAEQYSENKEFGPVSEKEIEDDLTAAEIARAKIKREEEKKAIRAGYVRIKAKAKEIRQNYRKAVAEGQRSGSGGVVCDHWEELKALWGGSPATVEIRNAVISTQAGQDEEDFGSEEEVISPNEEEDVVETPCDKGSEEPTGKAKSLNLH